MDQIMTVEHIAEVRARIDRGMVCVQDACCLCTSHEAFRQKHKRMREALLEIEQMHEGEPFNHKIMDLIRRALNDSRTTEEARAIRDAKDAQKSDDEGYLM